MPTVDDRAPLLTVDLEVSGEPLKGRITDYELRSHWDEPSDGFTFTVVSDDPVGLRRQLRPTHPVRLSIDGNLQIIGRILRTTGTGEGSALQVEGSDFIVDMTKAGADPAIKFTKGQTLSDAILSVAKTVGINKLSADGFNATRNLLTGKSPKKGAPARKPEQSKLEEFKIGANQTVWQTCNKIAHRHGFSILPGPDRSTIVLAEPEYNQEPLWTLTKGEGGNIKRGVADRNYTNCPTVAIATGRGGKTGSRLASLRTEVPVFGEGSPSKLGENNEVLDTVVSTARITRVDPKNPTDVGGGLLYRPMFYKDEDSRNQEQLDRGARRMIAERLRETLTYRATTYGLIDPESGAPYAVDTLVNVTDETEDVNETLWVLSRVFRYSEGGGTETQLELIRPESYVF